MNPFELPESAFEPYVCEYDNYLDRRKDQIHANIEKVSKELEFGNLWVKVLGAAIHNCDEAWELARIYGLHKADLAVINNDEKWLNEIVYDECHPTDFYPDLE